MNNKGRLFAIIIVIMLIIIAVNLTYGPDVDCVTADPNLDLSGVRGLAMSAAGVHGISYSGVLQELCKRGLDLNNITHIIGSSAGSIYAALLACRMSLQDITDFVKSVDTSKAISPDYAHEEILYALYSLSKYNSKYIEEVLEEILLKVTGVKNITLQQVYEKFGVTVILTATNNKRVIQPIYISRYSYPETPLAHAVRISSNIPGMFESIDFHGHRVSDGGSVDYYPLRELTHYLDIDECIGITMDPYNIAVRPKNVIDDFAQKARMWTYGLIRIHPKFRLTETEKRRTIVVTCKGCPGFLNLSTSAEDREKIYDAGVTAVQRYFSGWEYCL